MFHIKAVRGVMVSVNTDDLKMFGSSLAVEYQLLKQECGFSNPHFSQIKKRPVDLMVGSVLIH